jgi:hypothetical protein
MQGNGKFLGQLRQKFCFAAGQVKKSQQAMVYFEQYSQLFLYSAACPLQCFVGSKVL